MIKIADLRRIKKLCFDKIGANAAARRDLSVQIKPINEEIYTVIMSNGNDYARLVANFTQPTKFEEVNLAWSDFQKVCEFFDKIITITVKDNQYEIKEGKSKLKCVKIKSEANNACSFKFDFDENAHKISMDDCFIMLDKKLQTCPFVLCENAIASTDTNFAVINYLNKDFGDTPHFFVNKFPAGTWFFNPDKRIIVSEDKKIACTFRKATSGCPYTALKQLVAQPLTNWFEVDAKPFKELIDKCYKIDEKIILEFAQDEINIIADSKEFSVNFAVSIPAKYDHTPTRKDLRFMYKYLAEYIRCTDENGKLRILFDDAQSTYMTRSVGKNLTIFGMSLQPPHLLR